MIASDVDPIELVVWLPALCRKMGVPYAIVNNKVRAAPLPHLLAGPPFASLCPSLFPSRPTSVAIVAHKSVVHCSFAGLPACRAAWGRWFTRRRPPPWRSPPSRRRTQPRLRRSPVRRPTNLTYCLFKSWPFVPSPGALGSQTELSALILTEHLIICSLSPRCCCCRDGQRALCQQRGGAPQVGRRHHGP